MGLNFECFWSVWQADDGTIHVPFFSISYGSGSFMVLFPVVGFILTWGNKQ